MTSQFKRSAIMNYVLIFGPIGMMWVLMMVILFSQLADHNSILFYVGIAGMLAGYALLTNSKWDQIRKGDFFTWGTSPQMAGQYRLSYVIMVSSWLLACFSGVL